MRTGFYWYRGRADDLLKVGGIWVAPLEVENCLLKHPAVAEVAVVGYEEGGLTLPVAFVVLRDGHEPEIQELQDFVRSELSPHKYPRDVRFVSELPKTASGKVDRKSLAKPSGGSRLVEYVVGIDIGGTCTDCVVVGEGGDVTLGKAFSTPPDFSGGIEDALGTAAHELGTDVGTILANTRLFLHSSTVAENAVVDGTLARAGIVTTRGFEDTLFAMRGGYGRWSGLTEDEKRNPVDTDKLPAIVPRDLIVGIRERIDSNGDVKAAAQEADIEQAVQTLVDADVEAIGVSTLWSFVNSETEKQVAEVVRRLAPKVFLTLSHEIAPVVGEYERTSTAALNARLGPVVHGYLDSLRSNLADARLQGPAARRAGLRRPAARGRGGGAAGRDDRVRPRQRPRRLPGARRAARPAQHHRRGHGRHDLQGRHGPRGPDRVPARVDGPALPLRAAEDGRRLARAGRRQHHLRRRAHRDTADRPEERRFLSGPGLLRARRRGADDHRHRRDPRLSQSRLLPRRPCRARHRRRPGGSSRRRWRRRSASS